MIVLAFDPGTATTGFAVIEKQAGEKLVALDYGVIRTTPDEEAHKRLQRLYNEVERLITTHNPVSVATERLFFSRNETTAIAVGRAIGVILLAIAQHDLPWSEYTPLQVKLGVTGTGTADKSQVQWMVTRLLNLKETPKPDDAADACAVGICHIHSSKLAALGVKTR
jgi:crossover junction endodeoxyribonuclease RuvC